jgi:Microtubule binding
VVLCLSVLFAKMVKISVTLRSRPHHGPPAASTADNKSTLTNSYSIEYNERTTDEVKKSSITYTLRGGGRHEFAFERVFRESSSQQEIFGHYSHVVDDAIEGFNACILAYGQTGAYHPNISIRVDQLTRSCSYLLTSLASTNRALHTVNHLGVLVKQGRERWAPDIFSMLRLIRIELN